MEPTSTGGGGLLLIVMIIGYFLPFIVAITRLQPNTVSIFVLNLLLGWTLIGWVVALVWSFKAKEKPTIVYMEKPPEGG